MKIKKIEHIKYEKKIPVYDVINATSEHNFILSNKTVVHNCAIMDECNFARAGIKDINKAKERMKELYDSVVARVEGTFRLRGKVYGKVFSVSSKKSDSDFLEAHVETQLKAGNKNMYVADRPQWEVLPPEMFSDGTFHIAVGDRYKKGFVVDNESPQALKELRDQGYELMKVPIDMKTNFLADFEISLRDLAGISVPGLLSFITQESITPCLGYRKNPFLNDVLEIGTKDTNTLEQYFHIDSVEDRLKKCPLFIHVDLSISDDKTGICGTCISGRKDIEDDAGNKVSMPTYSQVFILSIQAPRGDKIPYAKITNFVVWLRRQGFNIQGISKDTFQSEYLGQLFEAQGFNVENRSLDRTPDGYMALRSILMEQRIDLLDVPNYQDELIHLQRDGFSGKVDHPVGGCFAGHTEIALTDGTKMSIIDLMHDNEYIKHRVYTYNTVSERIEEKPIKTIVKTKTVNRLMEVILDNGQHIYCTPDHKFLKQDGRYDEICNLHIDDELMSLDEECKIYSMRYRDIISDVYDLEIYDNPNFALGAGVFVHNSKDASDALAGTVWSATLDNPGIPVDRKTVASTIRAVNVNRPTASANKNTTNELNNIFGRNNYTKR